jgi:hypothetical protein
MKDFSDIFYAVKSGELSANKAAKLVSKKRSLWPKDGEYKYLYSEYPECREILEKIWC